MKKVFPTRRDIVSDGFDQALSILKKEVKDLKVWKIRSGTKAFTWRIPNKWEVKQAWIKFQGKKIIDLKNNPLHVWSYSQPVNKTVSRKQLLKHLCFDKKERGSVKFNFCYYKKNWGFSIPFSQVKELKEGNYQVFIDSEFRKGNLKIGVTNVKGKSKKTILVAAHLCHPFTANDGLSGVIVGTELIKWLQKSKPKFSYKFLFLPETIGSIAFLSKEGWNNIIGGVFLEMFGRPDKFALQFSRQENCLVDFAAKDFLKKTGKSFVTGKFGKLVKNDDYVINSANIGIPCISLSRSKGADKGHFKGYHSDLDCFENIGWNAMNESKKVAIGVFKEIEKRFVENDFFPLATFEGPVFLTGFGLWIDWRKDLELNQKVDDLMCLLDGRHCVSEISEILELNTKFLLNYLDKFYKLGLIKKLENRLV